MNETSRPAADAAAAATIIGLTLHWVGTCLIQVKSFKRLALASKNDNENVERYALNCTNASGMRQRLYNLILV